MTLLVFMVFGLYAALMQPLESMLVISRQSRLCRRCMWLRRAPSRTQQARRWRTCGAGTPRWPTSVVRARAAVRMRTLPVRWADPVPWLERGCSSLAVRSAAERRSKRLTCTTCCRATSGQHPPQALLLGAAEPRWARV